MANISWLADMPAEKKSTQTEEPQFTQINPWLAAIAGALTGFGGNPEFMPNLIRQRRSDEIALWRLKQGVQRAKLEQKIRELQAKQLQLDIDMENEPVEIGIPGRFEERLEPEISPSGIKEFAITPEGEPTTKPTINWLASGEAEKPPIKVETPSAIKKKWIEPKKETMTARKAKWLFGPKLPEMLGYTDESEYTLSPGEVRFKGSRKIAEVPGNVVGAKPTFGMDYDKVAWTLYGKVYRDLNSQEKENVRTQWETLERKEEKPVRIPFAEQQLRAIWPNLTKEQQMQVLKIIPPDKEITEKDIISIYANIFSAPDVRKKLEPMVREILSKTTTKRGLAGERKFSTPEEVKAAYKTGLISETEAIRILKEQWPEAFK
jgi:hypothetical protein